MKVATKFHLLLAAAVGLVLLDAVLHHVATRPDTRTHASVRGILTVEIATTRVALERSEELRQRLDLATPAERGVWRERFRPMEQHFAALRELLRQIALQEAERGRARSTLLQPAEAALQAIEQDWQNFSRLAESDPLTAFRDAARQLSPRIAAELQPALRELQSLLELERTRLEQTVEDSAAREARWHLTDLVLLLMLIGGSVLAIRRWVLAPLRHIESDARLIHLGQRASLGLRYTKEDEIGAVARAVNDTVDKLRSTAFSRDELESQVRLRTAELRERERELSASRAQLQRALDGSQLGTWEWDLRTDHVDFVALTCDILGYAPGEIEPHRRAWEQLVHPDDLPRAVAASRAHFAGESSNYEVELRLRAQSGEWHWVRSIGRIVERDSADQPLRVAGTHADIHIRKSTEATLAHRDAQLSIALATTGCSLWDADLAKGRVFVDEQWAVIAGGHTGARQISIPRLLARIPPSDRAVVFAAFARVLQGESDDYSMEHRYRHADGSLIWLRARARCTERANDGRALRIIGTHLDITATKRLAESLQRQAGLYSAVNRITVDLLGKRATADVLQALVERATTLFDAQTCEFALREDEQLLLRAAHGVIVSTSTPPIARETSLAWRAIDSLLPTVSDSHTTLLRPLGTGSSAVFPIIDQGRAIGVLALGRNRPKQPFNLDDIQKGILLAQLAALVLHNASIYEDAVRDAEAKTSALRESEWQLREAQRIARLGHWEYSFISGTRLEKWSDETFNIFGHPPQSFVIDRPRFDSLVHPDDLAGVRAVVDAAFGERRKFHMDYRIVRPDGSIRWIHDEGEPKRNVQGHIVGMQGIIQDVTDRVMADTALRDREALYRSLVESIDHGYYVANYRSLFTYVSPAMEAMGGFAPGELLGISAFRLIAEEDRRRVIQEYRAWRDDPECFNVRSEFRVRAKNGRQFWVEQSTHFERDPSGWMVEGRNVIRDISERRTAEAALRESEAKFRDLFDHSPVSVVLTSLPAGRVVDLNATASQVFGYRREDVVGRTTVEISLWVNESQRAAFVETLTSGQSIGDMQAEVRRADGTLAHVIINACLATIGGVRCALSTLTDVSEFRRTQQALHDSEVRFHGVFDKSPIPIILSELPDSRIIEANPAAEEFFGLTREEAFGRKVNELEVWASSAMRENCLAELHRTGSVTNFESQFRLRDGRVVYALFNATIVRLGERDMILASLLDITARKQMEAALRESQERYLAVFAESPMMIFLVTFPEGTVVEVNAAACAGFGYERHALLERTSVELHIWVDAGDRVRYLQTLRENRRVVNFETRLRRNTGEVFPALFNGSLIEIAGRQYSLSSIQDITAQRQAEERLRQTQKMESLGTLAGGIAHDFNNLLTGILGFVELARTDLSIDQKARPWLENIAQAGERAKKLVQQILTFSRQSDAERSMVDPAPLVAEALRLARSTLPPMVQIETRFETPLPVITVNPTQFHQVVMNLLTNAWHALPPDGGTIRVELHHVRITEANRAEFAELPLGDAVKLTIADTGCGMNQATLGRIFDPFFTTKPPGQGTGLGLAVVHGIVRSHGGAIAVSSRLGEGTTFDIVLPALSRSPAAVIAPPSTQQGAGQSILLVDDDEMARTPLTLLLKRLGYTVESMDEPVLALERFAAQPHAYDLVITDFAMPVLSGAELTRRIRATRPDIPVLLLSGFVDPTHQQSLDACEATLVLRKPVMLSDLSNAVTQCLESHPSRKATKG